MVIQFYFINNSYLLITYYSLLITHYLKNAKNNFSHCKFYSARIVHDFLTPEKVQNQHASPELDVSDEQLDIDDDDFDDN
ncbi:hypothetical protein [Nostoc sp. TCL240-02]|uniref:hypothetical protein n=1 Tax=Nostoc sp. TCL240-02 TaxID=2572090 RepID=UPI00157F92B5|nr:hypothetical protein [Nostoc sp. TCL240-02]QKQ73479.1 hypothetical protein FBB35_09135 [Nostoc sp. TCL240-02]